MKMSDGIREVDAAMSSGEAFAILVGLAAGASLTEAMVESDPERLAPQLSRERAALNLVEDFLKVHLYGDCTPCG